VCQSLESAGRLAEQVDRWPKEIASLQAGEWTVSQVSRTVLAVAALGWLAAIAHADEVDTLIERSQTALTSGDYPGAERLAVQALKLSRRTRQGRPAELAGAENWLAIVYYQQGKYEQAIPYAEYALKLWQSALGDEHIDVATAKNNLAAIHKSTRRLEAAEKLYREALATRRRLLPRNHTDLAGVLNNLGALHVAQGRPAEAVPLLEEALAIWTARSGADSLDVATALRHLADVRVQLGQLGEARKLIERSLAIQRRQMPEAHPQLLRSEVDYAVTLRRCGDLAAAEQSLLQLETKLDRLPNANPDVRFSTITLLGLLANAGGRYRLAEERLQRAARLSEASLGPQHASFATALNNLAGIRRNQARNDEALELYDRSFAIMRAVQPPRLTELGGTANNRGIALHRLRRFDDAESAFRQALELTPDHEQHQRAVVLDNLCLVASDREQWQQAAEWNQAALRMLEATPNAHRLDLGVALTNSAHLAWRRGDWDAVGPPADRAIELLEASHAAERDRAWAWFYRALARRHHGAAAEADQALERAVALAEAARAQSSGLATDRAVMFGDFAQLLEVQSLWRWSDGDAAGAFLAAERRRGRSLADQLRVQGIDLLAGVPEALARPVREEYEQSRQRLTDLQAQVAARDPRATDLQPLRSQIDVASRQLVEASRRLLDRSRVYQAAAATEFAAVDLPQLQERLGVSRSRLVEYLVGEQNALAFLVTPDRAPQAWRLQIEPTDAEILGVEPGAVTAAKLQTALSPLRDALKAAGEGALSPDVLNRLAALARLLLPTALRDGLLEEGADRAIFVVDGPLHRLPLETLVLEAGDQPRFLLDAPLSVVHRSSAAAMLRVRPDDPAATGPERVLTLGAADYPGTHPGNALVDLPLQDLPGTRQESDLIAADCRQKQLAVTQLLAGSATEARLRESLPDQTVVHLACHGRSETRFGNFFGALLLTPGEGSPTAGNDGILTLAEVAELPLSNCRLAILSACDTHDGPWQPGEGLWSLSRGFLAAGADRVAASSWLVDDEAGAELIAEFFRQLGASTGDESVDNAPQALRDAKRRLRADARWSHPFYWAGYLLTE